MQFWPRGLGRQRALATWQCPVRSHRLRSSRNATCEPGVMGRCGATRGRTRAVSACPTRAVYPALSRPRTLRGGGQECQLDRTACARYGTQRVGRAVRGGAGRLCWAIACGGGPPPRARTSCPGCACAWSCGATHGTVARACWCRRAIGATLHRPWSPYATGTGPLRRPQALGRHDEAQRPEPPPARACCWYLCRGW